jgi:gliding motility-associated-like protein
MVNCWDNFEFNTTSCTWNNTGSQDAEPVMVNCWDNFEFNTTSCTWNNTGSQDAEPAMVNCWDNFEFNTTSCTWNNTGSQDAEPVMVNCWDNFEFNTNSCAWNNTGSQDAEPALVNCWDNFEFNTTICEWINTGSESAAPVATCTSVNGDCSNNNEASASVSTTGGTAPYTYLWSTGATTTSISNITAGSYTVTVTDGNGCSSDCSLTVEVTPCCNVTDPGKIATDQENCGPFDVDGLTNLITPTGGLGDLEIVWITREGTTGPWQEIPGSDGLTYDPGVVSETSQFRRCVRRVGCTNYEETDIITIIVNEIPTVPAMVYCWDNFELDTTTCEWNNIGFQDAEPAMVNCWDNFEFNTTTCAWNNIGSQDAEPAIVNCWDNFEFNTTSCEWINTGSQDAEPSMVNCWDNFVFNTNSCEWINTGSQDAEPVTVNCWDNFEFNTNSCEWINTGSQDAESADVYAGDDVSICVGEDVTLTATGGDANTVYTWYLDGGVVSISQSITVSPGIGISEYTVEAMNEICNTTSTDYVKVWVYDYPLAGFERNPAGDVTFGDETNFTDTTMGTVTDWHWDFGDGMTSMNQDPTHDYASPGSYWVELIASNNGCEDTVRAGLEVKIIIDIPNTFTPNNDGTNDVISLTGSGLEVVKMSIFNRWGHRVYDIEGRQISWSGKTTGGTDAKSGTYYYVIEMNYIDGNTSTQTGFFTLIR